jgi:hypothetical protein
MEKRSNPCGERGVRVIDMRSRRRTTSMRKLKRIRES